MERELKSYRDLIVWQKSMELVKNIYFLTKKLPKEEDYVLTSQIRRSAISIPSNIAEGYGRGHRLEYIRFLEIARGSLLELQTQPEICILVNYIELNNLTPPIELSKEIEKMLNSLIKKLKENK